MEKNKNKLIVAGPCAIENKSQFLKTVEKIKNVTDIIRCGVWKARTSANSFRGVGQRSLPWIDFVQKQLSIPCAVEVGTISHIKQALKYNIKIFWIGARTTCNPFIIQEMADFLKNEEVEIWIKNPIIPDVELWFGAIERFQKNNLNELKIIHRGFFSTKSREYRNLPRWDILKKIKSKYPNIPLICDPSHICGDYNRIEKFIHRALLEDFQGLMLEVHQNPLEALSDEKQQLTPEHFSSILKRLKLK